MSSTSRLQPGRLWLHSARDTQGGATNQLLYRCQQLHSCSSYNRKATSSTQWSKTINTTTNQLKHLAQTSYVKHRDAHTHTNIYMHPTSFPKDAPKLEHTNRSSIQKQKAQMNLNRHIPTMLLGLSMSVKQGYTTDKDMLKFLQDSYVFGELSEDHILYPSLEIYDGAGHCYFKKD